MELNFREISWCYSEKSAVSQLAETAAGRVCFHLGVPKFDNASGESKLVILDDLLNDVYSKEVCDLFTKGSRDRNISVILITQHLFHQGRYSHETSVNAKYLVVFKNVRHKIQFAYLTRQMYPENSNSLYQTYLEATQKPHGYLLLDLSQDTDDLLRFRMNIFPRDIPIVYDPLENEEDKVELFYPSGT
jgi:hypothetical protein